MYVAIGLKYSYNDIHTSFCIHSGYWKFLDYLARGDAGSGYRASHSSSAPDGASLAERRVMYIATPAG